MNSFLVFTDELNTCDKQGCFYVWCLPFELQARNGWYCPDKRLHSNYLSHWILIRIWQWQRSQQQKAAIRKRFQVPSFFKHGMPDEARCRHITSQEQVRCNSKYAGPSPAEKRQDQVRQKHVAPSLSEHAEKGLLQGVWSGDEIAASVARICWKCNCLLSQLVKKNKSANHCYHDILLLYIVAVTFYLFLRFLSKLDACLIAEKDFNLKLHHTHIWESDSLQFHFAWLEDEQSFRSKFNMFKSLKKLKCLQILGFFW